MKMNQKRFLLILFSLLPLFQPAIFLKFNMMNYLYGGCLVLEFLYFTYVYYKEKIKFGTFFGLLVLYRFVLAFPTIMLHGDILKFISFTFTIMNLYYVINYFVRKGEMKRLLYATITLFTILLAINYLTILVFPKGIIDEMYFLGIRTRITEYAFILLVLLVFAVNIIKTQKYKFILLIPLFVLSINTFSQWVATCIAGMMIFLAIGLVDYMISKKIKLSISYRVAFIVAQLAFVLIVFANIQVLFEPILVHILKKDATLTYRTKLWANAWEVIFKRPIIGHGITLDNGNFTFDGVAYVQGHNQIIQSLYDGGMVTTALLLAILYESGKLLKGKTLQEKILIYGAFTYMIMMIVEIYMYYASSFFLFIFLYAYSRKSYEEFSVENGVVNTKLLLEQEGIESYV